MARIPKEQEERIKAKLSIVDALDEVGCEMTKRGANWIGRNPFRDDKHSGSFVANERKNIAKDFSTGEKYTPIQVLIEGGVCKDYGEALRYAAAMVHEFIDDSKEKPIVRKKRSPRPNPKELPTITFPGNYLDEYVGHEHDNVLLTYLLNLPLAPNIIDQMREMMQQYGVGTCLNGWTKGFTIWPFRHWDGKIRTAKFMKYKPDGHRDKDAKYNFTWMHSVLDKVKYDKNGNRYENTKGIWSSDEAEVRRCLFGMHLLDRYPKADVCIVESEKTAVICSAFYNPEDKLWMATGGKEGLSIDMLLPIMDRKRTIVLYPDIDAFENWKDQGNMIEYENIYISHAPLLNWKPEDGDKADMADILIRLGTAPEETLGMRLADELCHPEKAEALDYLINKMQLTL